LTKVVVVSQNVVTKRRWTSKGFDPTVIGSSRLDMGRH